eukprot:TRINITY_DN59343_c0_g1_i1.p1 TRINITY_DN59343_c0_g1~~TRINITY_DN59343_c0_g1_i1.p1  ORF type:complete len:408 (-),score=69.26 TRINITY_DN59343_c0_g1_i1:108-1331(-)
MLVGQPEQSEMSPANAQDADGATADVAAPAEDDEQSIRSLSRRGNEASPLRMEVLAPPHAAVGAGGHHVNTQKCCGLCLCHEEHMVQLSFLVNLMLFLIKIVVFVWSGSLSVLASLVDSTVDLLGQGVLMMASKFADLPEQSLVSYPAGVARVEPLGVIVCAVVMSMGSLLVMKDAAMTLVAVYAYGEDPPVIELSLFSGGFLLGVIALKIMLWVICHGLVSKGNVSLEAVAQDHQNDVASNSAALLAAALATHFPKWWMIDAVGALLIGIWITRCWAATAREQADLLLGKTAEPEFLEKVRELAASQVPLVTLDAVRAYYFGPKFLVEIDVVMAPSTPLAESHDVGVALQHKIECLEDCERCFVHIDYQRRQVDDHDPKVPLAEKIGKSGTEGEVVRRRGHWVDGV